MTTMIMVTMTMIILRMVTGDLYAEDSTGDEMPLENHTPLCVLRCPNNSDPSELALVKSGTTSSIFVSFVLGLWLIKYNFDF